MDVSASSWLLIVVALVAANLPFFNERVLAMIPWKAAPLGLSKPAWVRIAELILYYFVVGAIAYGLEARLGNAFVQTWEFYAISGCFFIVLAFPGFVLRYLRKRR